MQVFLLISMSFGLGPLAFLLSDPKQQKDLCSLSEFPLDVYLCLPATGWGDKTNIKTGEKNLFLCLQKCGTAIPIYSKLKLATSASFSVLHLEDSESSILYKEKISIPFEIWKYKVLTVGHSRWVRAKAKTLLQV